MSISFVYGYGWYFISHPMRLFIFLLLFSVSADSFAQTYILPRLTYNRFKLYGDNSINKWKIHSLAYWEEGVSIGMGVRHQLGKVYLQGELNLADHFDTVGLINTQVDRVPSWGAYLSEWSLGSSAQRMTRLELPLLVGYDICTIHTIKLRIFTGLIPAYRFKERYLDYHIDEAILLGDYLYARQSLVVENVSNMYVPFSLDATIGIGVDLGKFTIDVRRTQEIGRAHV